MFGRDCLLYNYSLAKHNTPPGLVQLGFQRHCPSILPACVCVRIVLQDLAVGMGKGPPPPSGTHGSQGAWEGGGVGSREGEADVGSEALPELVKELRTPENCAVSCHLILQHIMESSTMASRFRFGFDFGGAIYTSYVYCTSFVY